MVVADCDDGMEWVSSRRYDSSVRFWWWLWSGCRVRGMLVVGDCGGGEVGVE